VNWNYVLYDPEKGEYIQQEKQVDFEQTQNNSTEEELDEEEELHQIQRQLKEENSVSVDSRSTTPDV
jgi:hypothetical protein